MDSNKIGSLATLIDDRTRAALGGHSPAEAAVMSALHFRPGIIANALPPIVGLCQPGVARLLRGLERKGYVARRAAVGRIVPIVLTEAGKREVQQFHEARKQALDEILAPLEPEVRALFEDIAAKLLAAAIPSRAAGRRSCRLCDYDRCAEAGCPVEARVDEIDGGVDWRREYLRPGRRN